MLGFVFCLLFNAFYLLFFPLFFFRRRSAAPKGGWIEVKVDGPVVELGRAARFWEVGPRPLSLESLRRAIELSASDPRVVGFLVRVEELRAGSATATALREALLSAKAVGKRVIVYLPFGGATREFFVGSAAHVLLLGPESHLAPAGFAVQTPYLKDALDRVGVGVEVFSRGRYKTAGEPLILREMSTPQREQLEAFLDDAWGVLVDALATGRQVDRARAESWIDVGLWSAQEAIENGLCDGVAYEEDLAKTVDPTREHGAARVPLRRYIRRRSGGWRPFSRPHRIAVIGVTGPIVPRASGPLPMSSAEDIRETIRMALELPRYRGAIVHIDSRGGSALASDHILHGLRQLAERKPVVACFGDAAASGGYLVAMGAGTIVAQPNTLTGSIGVVAAHWTLGQLLQRVGIRVEVLKRGPRADLLSPARPVESAERALLDRQLDAFYQSFLRAVSEGRNMSLERVEGLAGGRIYSGRQALELGLVDRLGGFDTALAEVRKVIGPRGAKLRPELLVASTRRRLPNPARWLAAWLEGRGLRVVGERWMMSAGVPHDRIWAFCDAAEHDLGT
ncbi:MAG TPA: signal peptide peptidase SppA [Polyangiaceae bacterium]|jgi:protease-4